MVRHIVTFKCPRSCPYCVNQKLQKVEEAFNQEARRTLYALLEKAGYKEIMLTGGEPLDSTQFYEILNDAADFFKVHLTTQDEDFLARFQDGEVFPHDLNALASVIFSIHGRTIPRVFISRRNPPVYAAVVDELFHPDLPFVLDALGYSGLTINANHLKDEEFRFTDGYEKLYPEDFSLKINQPGHCLKNNLTILPNLQIVENCGV